MTGIASEVIKGFKPCYKRNTFNTGKGGKLARSAKGVLNLVIRGIPSIRTVLLVLFVLGFLF